MHPVSAPGNEDVYMRSSGVKKTQVSPDFSTEKSSKEWMKAPKTAGCSRTQSSVLKCRHLLRVPHNLPVHDHGLQRRLYANFKRMPPVIIRLVIRNP